MSVSHVMFSGWRRVLAAFDVSDHPTLLKILCDAHRAEADTVVQYTQHAHHMHYPHFRAELLRLAAEVQAHLPWLCEQIRALDGSLPFSSPSPLLEGNSWECLRRDVEEARRGCDRLLEWSHRAEREMPALAVGLQRIRRDKLRHREELRQLFMRSDPYSISTMASPQDQDEDRKQAWIEQRKNDWLDHERAAWEVEGKQTPWAEWAGEQELKWATELPHYYRAWTQRLAEKRETATRHTRLQG